MQSFFVLGILTLLSSYFVVLNLNSNLNNSIRNKSLNNYAQNYIYHNNTAASTNIYVNCNANSEPSGYYENPSAGQTRSVTWSGSCSSFDK